MWVLGTQYALGQTVQDWFRKSLSLRDEGESDSFPDKAWEALGPLWAPRYTSLLLPAFEHGW